MVAVVATSLRQNTYYVQVYVIYMNLVLNGLIPLVSLVILNTLVYLRLWKFSQCVETSMRNQSVQLREVMLAKVSCLIVAGKKVTVRMIVIFVLTFQFSSSATVFAGYQTYSSFSKEQLAR